MSGSVCSSMFQKLSFLDLILWKLIINSLKLRLVILFLVCCLGLFFGDDVVNGGPIVEMSRTDPSVSEVVLNEAFGSIKSSKRLVLKFGKPQLQQYQLISVFSNASNICVFIFKQCLWYHSSQLLHATEKTVLDHVHALPHIWQGYFGARGPGFGWQSLAFSNTSANIYKYALRS